jgi:hypothetical protein
MTPVDDLTLAEGVELLVYGADCRTCKTGTRRIDLKRLLERLGPNIRMRDIRPLLRCSACGGKDVIVVMHWKSATTTDRMTAHWIDSNPVR